MRQRTIVCPIIQNDGAYLLCKMADDRGVFPGQWALSGGGMEPGETMEQALRREIREELGEALEIVSVTPWAFRDDIRVKTYADGTTEEIYMIYLIFDCMSANLFSAFHTLAGFVGALGKAGQPGAAVLVSSAAARIGTPNHEAVAAAKAGVEGLVRGAAATYAGAGIRINAVAPGIMETPASARIIANDSAREAAARQYPLPGIGDPAELAGLMAWLLSPEAGRVTGQVWSMDGGFASIRPLVK